MQIIQRKCRPLWNRSQIWLLTGNHCTQQMKIKWHDLNNFYLRYDSHDFSVEHVSIISIIEIVDCVPQTDISPGDVTRLAKKINTNKPTGPDGVSAFLLKICAEKRTPALVSVFQRSADSHTVSSLWKTAIITPLTKKPVPKENNDYTPVALTSNVG